MTNQPPQPGQANRAPRRGRGIPASIGLALGPTLVELSRGISDPVRLMQDAIGGVVAADLIQDVNNLRERGRKKDYAELRRALISAADIAAAVLVMGVNVAQIAIGDMPMTAIMGTPANRNMMQARAMLTQLVDAALDIKQEIDDHGKTGWGQVAVGAMPFLVGALAGGGVAAADIAILGGDPVQAGLAGGVVTGCVANVITTAVSQREGKPLAVTDIVTSMGIAGSEIVGMILPDPVSQAIVPLAEATFMAGNRAIHRANS